MSPAVSRATCAAGSWGRVNGLALPVRREVKGSVSGGAVTKMCRRFLGAGIEVGREDSGLCGPALHQGCYQL